MKIILALFAVLTLTLSLTAQLPKKWRDVSTDDFNYQTIDDTSHAVILQEQAFYHFDAYVEELRFIVDITRRILILDSTGVKIYKSLSIPYIGKYNFEQITEFQEITYNKNGSKISQSKLRKKNVKDIKLDDTNNLKFANFPDVKIGSIIEYHYSVASLNMLNPPAWYFQHEIPCLFSTISIMTPSFINYQISVSDSSKIAKKQTDNLYSNYNFTIDYQDPIPSGLYYRSKNFTAPANLSVLSKMYTYTLHNIAEYKAEPYIDCERNYKTNLNLSLVNVDQKTGFVSDYERFAWFMFSNRIYNVTANNNEISNYSYIDKTQSDYGFIVYRVRDWDNFNNILKKDVNFGLRLIKYWNFRLLLNSIVQTNSNDKLSNAICIFNYIKDNFTWNEQYSIYTSNDFDKTAISKKGNSADLNLIMVSLLQKQGLDAYPILVKTVDKGHLDFDLASTQQFDNVIAGVDIDGKTYFFDAVKKNLPWFLINNDDLNGFGRSFRDEKSGFVEILPNEKSYSNTKINLKLNDSIANCSVKQDYTGYFAIAFENKTDSLTNSVVEQFADIDNFSYQIAKQPIDSGLCINYKFTTADFIEQNEFYPFTLLKIQNFFANPYRENPVYIIFPQTYNYELSFEIPENTTISQIPSDFIIDYKNASMIFKVEQTTNNVTFKLSVKYKNNFYNLNEYLNLREFYLKMLDLVNTSITLKHN